MKANIDNLLEEKLLQRKLLSMPEKDRRRYIRNEKRRAEDLRTFVNQLPSMNRRRQLLASDVHIAKMENLDFLTSKANKNRQSIESLDSEIENLLNEKRMMQMNFAGGGNTMDIKQQTKNVAAQGRYGDSMLLHVNPAEVKGLAQAMPITINPQTGQPEAFLPFLAPLLGSALGSAFLPTLIPALAGKAALTAGIGAGLATYAQTGGSGSKALLSGLTAGFGTNAMNTAAADATARGAAEAAATAGADAATQAAVQDASRVATTNLLREQPLNLIDSTKTIFGQPGGFDTGAKALFAGATSPSGIAATTAAGTGAIMQSRDDFEASLLANEEERRRRRQAILDANPENIPLVFSESGRSTLIGKQKNIDANEDGKISGEDFKILNAQKKDKTVELNRGQSIRRQVEAQIADEAEKIAMMNQPNPYLEEGSSPVPVARREATNIPTGFMAGFQPEMQYFKNLNPTATEITEGQSAPTGGTMPMPPRSFPRPFDPTETAAYRNFYGQGADLSIPMQVDPYSPVTYQEKPRFVAQPTLPVITPETPTLGPALPTTSEGVGLGALFDNLPTTGTPSVGKGAAIAETPDISEEQISNFVSQNLPQTSLPALDFDRSDVAGSLKRGATPSQQDILSIYTPYLLGSKNPEKTLGEIKALEDAGFALEGASPTSDTKIEGSSFVSKDQENQSDVTVPPTTFPQMPAILSSPVSRKSELEMYEDTMNEMPLLRQAGGLTDIDMQDPLVQKTIKFILGELDSDTIVQQFIDKYSPEDYRNLRRAVLTTVVPDAQTEGMIKGVNNGGMKDDIGGMIGSSQPVAVSQDEYIIPADAVAMLGDGSSDSGAKKLDAMLDRIRMDKTGTTRQAKEIDNRVLPA